MTLIRRLQFIFPAAVLAGLAASACASPFMPASVLQVGTGSAGRSLLQNKIDCPIDFENQNYTILTRRCKPPQYPPSECCDAFKKFACPFVVYITNLSTNCADNMLTYINLRGSYPPALFANECLKGNQDIPCDDTPRVDAGVPSGVRQAQGSSRRPLIALLCGLGALLFH